MPGWDLHNRWAARLGVPEHVSALVNLLIDFPERCHEYQDFCAKNPSARVNRRGRPTQVTAGKLDFHDSGRRLPALRAAHLKFLGEKGSDHVKAWYLHHMLDYLKWWVDPRQGGLNTVPPIQDILTDRRLKKRIGNPQDPQLLTVKVFVTQNSESILGDLLESTGQAIR